MFQNVREATENNNFRSSRFKKAQFNDFFLWFAYILVIKPTYNEILKV